MSKSLLPDDKKLSSSSSPTNLNELLSGYTPLQLWQLAVEIRQLLKARKISFTTIKEKLAATTTNKLTKITIQRLFGTVPSSEHQAKKETQYRELLEAMCEAEDVKISRVKASEPIPLEITLKGELQPLFYFPAAPVNKSIQYRCYYYNVYKQEVLQGTLTLYRENNDATITLSANATDDRVASTDEQELTGDWHEKENSTVFVHLHKKGKHRNWIDLIISAGATSLFTNEAAPAFSLNNAQSYLVGTFSTLYSLSKQPGTVPSVGLMLLKRVTDTPDSSEDIQQINYFLVHKVLAAPDPETLQIMGDSWSELRNLAGNYVGYYIKTIDGNLHRFTCSIGMDGRTTLQLPDDQENTTSELIDDHQTEAIRSPRIVKGQAHIIGSKSQLLALDFDFQRLMGQYRFRFLFKLVKPGQWYWGHGDGLENKTFQIVTSRAAIRQVEKLVEPAIFPLNNAVDFKLATAENSGELFDFFVGNTEPDLTEISIILKLKGVDTKAEQDAKPRFTGLFEVYSLERRFVDEPEFPGARIRRYFIVKYPLRVCEDGIAWMRFSRDSAPVQATELQWGGNYLAVTFRTNDQQKIPGTSTNYIHFVFWYDDEDQIRRLYGISIRRGKMQAPEARVELFIKVPTSERFSEDIKNYPIGEIDFEEVKTHTKDETYKEWTNSEKNLHKSTIVRYLSGKINRLLLLHKTAKSGDGEIETRQENHRRIYFYQAYYFALKDDALAAFKSLVRAHRHGFGTISDDLMLLKRELAVFNAQSEKERKIADLQEAIEQLWPGTSLPGA